MQLGKGDKKDISVIITALNEENDILTVINRALRAYEAFNINGEILVFNDGSTDRTGELVNGIIKQDGRVRMISHDRPFGVGASLWEGVDASKGDLVVWFPADNENDPMEVLRYIPLFKHVDIVIAFTYNREVRPLFRNILSSLFLFIVNTTFKTSFNCTNTTTIYRKSILKHVGYRSTSLFVHAYTLIRSVKNGYLFAEVPTRLGLREAGKSKSLALHHLWPLAKDYLRLVKSVYCDQRTYLDKKDFSSDSLTATRRGE